MPARQSKDHWLLRRPKPRSVVNGGVFVLKNLGAFELEPKPRENARRHEFVATKAPEQPGLGMNDDITDSVVRQLQPDVIAKIDRHQGLGLRPGQILRVR